MRGPDPRIHPLEKEFHEDDGWPGQAPREWKIDLIVASNPDWRDLYDQIVQ
jgi:hypothetical protein